jgi:hypothetical protein
LNPNPRIKSPLLSSILLLELLSNNASTCRELSLCPVAGIRCALRVPDAAGAYRGIRATMEQPSMRIGLDHFAENVSGVAPRGYPSSVKGAALGATRHVVCDEGPVASGDTLGNFCWRQRCVLRSLPPGASRRRSGPSCWTRPALPVRRRVRAWRSRTSRRRAGSRG